MVQRSVTENVDDLTGEVVSAVTTVRWTWEGKPLVVDAGAESLKKIRAGSITLKELRAASRPDAAARTPPPRRVLRQNNQRVREWARKRGHEVSDRGRISQEILEAYRDAHPDDDF